MHWLSTPRRLDTLHIYSHALQIQIRLFVRKKLSRQLQLHHSSTSHVPVPYQVANASSRHACARHSEFVTIAFFLALSLSCLNANFLVVLLERSQVLSCLTEFTLFHAFADIMMNKGTLGVHQVELVVNA